MTIETPSKAQRILALLAEGKTPKEIAAAVGCLTAYVRTVRLRAESPGSVTPGERTWRTRNPDKYREMKARHKRNYYRSNPEFRERQNARTRAYYQAHKDDPAFKEAHLVAKRESYQRRKAEIAARRKLWRDERRAIVAAMVEVANAKA